MLNRPNRILARGQPRSYTSKVQVRNLITDQSFRGLLVGLLLRLGKAGRRRHRSRSQEPDSSLIKETVFVRSHIIVHSEKWQKVPRQLCTFFSKHVSLENQDWFTRSTNAPPLSSPGKSLCRLAPPPTPGGRLQASLSCASVWQAGDWRPRAGLGYLPMQFCLKMKIGLHAFSLANLKLLDI